MRLESTKWHLLGLLAILACVIVDWLAKIEAPFAIISLVPTLLVVFFRTTIGQKVVVAYTIALSVFMAVIVHHSGSQLITTAPNFGAILVAEHNYWPVFVVLEILIFVFSFALFFVLREKHR